MSSSPTDASLWAAILAGGVGSRFWPVSTPAHPKQLLPLGGEQPLIVDTVERIRPLVPPERLRILTGERVAGPIGDALPELDGDSLLVEPQAKSTAPALAWAAFEIARRDPDAVMASLHADHVIAPGEAFRGLLGDIAQLTADHDRLFTIGIEPTRPETGYGYIRVGERLGPQLEAYEVRDFVEKPDPDTAYEYIRRGGYLWNSGIFVWRVERLLSELERHTPELARLLPLLEDGKVDEYFARAPTLSIDEGLIERSDAVGVARATFQWDDVGAWDAIGRTRPADAHGNVGVGDAHLIETQDSIAWAEDGSVVVFGASDLVVVRTGDVTLVAPRERAADLKELLAELPESVRRLGG